jgi:hypothetical protein
MGHAPAGVGPLGFPREGQQGNTFFGATGIPPAPRGVTVTFGAKGIARRIPRETKRRSARVSGFADLSRIQRGFTVCKADRIAGQWAD